MDNKFHSQKSFSLQVSLKMANYFANRIKSNLQHYTIMIRYLPPVYITHKADNNVVDLENSIEYFEKLRHNKVPVEMHICPKGGHGFIPATGLDGTWITLDEKFYTIFMLCFFFAVLLPKAEIITRY
jgi:acetyl esterase/lipase